MNRLRRRRTEKAHEIGLIDSNRGSAPKDLAYAFITERVDPLREVHYTSHLQAARYDPSHLAYLHTVEDAFGCQLVERGLSLTEPADILAGAHDDATGCARFRVTDCPAIAAQIRNLEQFGWITDLRNRLGIELHDGLDISFAGSIEVDGDLRVAATPRQDQDDDPRNDCRQP